MAPPRLWLRAAVQMRAHWQRRRPDCPFAEALSRLRLSWQQVELVCRQHAVAHQKGWTLLQPSLVQALRAGLDCLRSSVRDAASALGEPASMVPTLSSLLADLQQLDGEFSELKIDLRRRQVSAFTESVTLEEVPLGPFAIHFHWARLGPRDGLGCFDIEPLEPNFPTANEHVCHPHVHYGKLCAGDATLPLIRAVADARLADAFLLIRGVLATYNPTSAYVSLDQWQGRNCSDCGDSMDEDDLFYCEGCEDQFCPGCTETCASCQKERCRSCLRPCTVCAARCCNRCLHMPAPSQRRCCPECLVTSQNSCKQVPSDDREEETPACCSAVPQANAQHAAADIPF